MTNNYTFASEAVEPINRAFLFGDAVSVTFYVRAGQLIMAEECYFYLMASMRKMRMNIPLSYTLEFFQSLFSEKVLAEGVKNAFIHLVVYRNADGRVLQKAGVSFWAEVEEVEDVLMIQGNNEMDMIKEISVNTHLLSGIRGHCPVSIYASIYARENDLDDVILLNPSKRIARSVFGNLLFLEGAVIKVPKQSEGAYVSPLMENFVTFVHRKGLAAIEQVELNAFESQKAEEILMISDYKGLFTVGKIRNKTFPLVRFTEMVAQWKASFENAL
ncbi:aminotransferase class IV [Bergeyella sp. RCAD1439]|uniref:aminotransferase class IV n=1 Tax=Bergeyella anatis TaxID=3113737 RepID=UPI002E18DFFB|nr:aminotransferase class IV [Bergeyella sp. RCAD1439]